MNYLAHGFRHIDSPYFLAGTAVPDWLSVVDRRVRMRSGPAKLLAEDDRESTICRTIAGGIAQHLADDRWFHETRVFAETSLQFAVELRERLPGDEGFRPSFLGHILVEILIDATLIRRDPPLVSAYYDALSRVEPERVQSVVNRLAKIGTHQLADWIRRFLAVRFLYDYLDDDKLLFRLEQIMARVGLPPLGSRLVEWLPAARRSVDDRCELLLTPPDAPSLILPSPTTRSIS